MLVAIMGAIAALAGVILGSVLNRSAEYRRWFRTESHAACARLLAVAEEARSVWELPNIVSRQIDENIPIVITQRAPSTASDNEPEARDAKASVPDDIARAKTTVMKELGLDLASRIGVHQTLHYRLLAAREEVRLLCPEVVGGYAVLFVNAAISLRNATTTEESEKCHAQYRAMRVEFILSAREFLHEPSVFDIRGRFSRRRKLTSKLARDARLDP